MKYNLNIVNIFNGLISNFKYPYIGDYRKGQAIIQVVKTRIEFFFR